MSAPRLSYASDKLPNTMCPQCAHLFHVRPPGSFMQALGDVMQVHDQRYDELLADMRELLGLSMGHREGFERNCLKPVCYLCEIDKLREKWGVK